MMSAPIYFDYAAATPLDERVFDAMRPYFSDRFFNPSAAYQAARSVRTELDEARHRLAIEIGAKRDEIVLTAGATESVNLAFLGLLSLEDHAVIGATEHAAVRDVAAMFDCTIAPSTSTGFITPEAIRKAVRDDTVLVSVTAADSELGTVQPLAKIGATVREIRHDRQARGIATPLYLHSDASQAAGALDLHVARLGVDLLSLNAAKSYGPKQVGLLWSRSDIQLQPLIRGGGQERGLRSGTENVAGAIGFARALEIAQSKRHAEAERVRKLRDRLQDGLTQLLPELIVNGSPKKRLPGHLNISLPGLDAERVVFHLDAKGLMLATGAACAANKGTRSTVLEATGMSPEAADGSLRISLGRYTTDAEIDRAIPMIADAIRTEKAL
jgi:cysteine desulfurase